MPVTFPVWIVLGPWRVHPHLAFDLLAYAVGGWIYRLQRRRLGDPLTDAHRWTVVTAAAISAVVGSRMLFWLEDPGATLRHLHSAHYLLGGQTIVGGLIGGWIAVEIAKRWVGVRQPTGDLFALPLALGIAVGRVGCFLSGLEDGTYGIATSVPWGVDLGDGRPRHPTSLYESLFMALLSIVLARAARTARRGDGFKLFLAAYLAFRLLIDAIKPEISIAFGLSAIQWASVAGLAYYSHWFLGTRPRRRAIDSRTATM